MSYENSASDDLARGLTDQWTRCLTHACVFPSGWEKEHANGPMALGNGTCEFVPDNR